MRFDVIEIDVPHMYNQRGNWKETRFRGGASATYIMMSLDLVKDLPLHTVSECPGVILSWVTCPLLPETLEYIEGWNVPLVEAGVRKQDRWKFSTVFLVWIKLCRGRYRRSLWAREDVAKDFITRGLVGFLDWVRVFGVGYWSKANPELVYLVSRGAPVLKPDDDSVSNLLFAPQTMLHSEKPYEAYDRAVELWGMDRTYLSIFSRVRQPGWMATGEELDGRDVFEYLEAAAKANTPREEHTYRALIEDPQWRADLQCQLCGSKPMYLWGVETVERKEKPPKKYERRTCKKCGHARKIRVG